VSQCKSYRCTEGLDCNKLEGHSGRHCDAFGETWDGCHCDAEARLKRAVDLLREWDETEMRPEAVRAFLAEVSTKGETP
jgi:hypothetical protein